MKLKRGRLLILLLAAVLCLSACGSPATARTLEEYTADVEAIMQQVDESDEKSLAVDYDDPAQVATYVTETKAIFQSLKDLAVPADAADAAEKLQSGADSMIEYLDMLSEYCAMEAGSTEAEAKRTEVLMVYSAGRGKLAEGVSALS